MKITEIGIVKATLLETLMDPSVYVIKKGSCFNEGKFEMCPIKEVSVEEMLSTDNAMIRIEK